MFSGFELYSRWVPLFFALRRIRGQSKGKGKVREANKCLCVIHLASLDICFCIYALHFLEFIENSGGNTFQNPEN